MQLRARPARPDNIVPLQRDLIADKAQMTSGHSAPTLAPRDLRPLGQILLEDGAVEEANLIKATALRHHETARLGEILLAHGWVSEAALIKALSRQ